ncbi:MAG: ABC transporter ATP-binding protein [Chloroflexales bacterium]|nr:ABC transporter ATP-binding protein [Chloroflexales bacterium]
MGFILDGLEAEAYDRSYSDAALIRRIVGYFRPHGRKIVGVALLVTAASLVEALIPFGVARGIDLLASNPAAQLLLGLAGLVTVLGSLGWLFNFLRQKLAAEAVGDVVLQLRDDAFAAVMQRDLSFYDQFPSGTIVSRVTSDTQDFSNVVTLTMDLMSQVLLVALVSVVLVVVQPSLGLLTIMTAPVVFLVALAFRRVARWTSQQARRAVAKVNSSIQETVSGIAVAKSFRQEAAVYEEFTATNNLAYRVSVRRGLVFDTIFPLLDAIAGLATAAVVYFGGARVLDGTISAGEWYLFVQGLMLFYFPLTSIASFWSQFQQGLASSERVFALIDAEPRVVQRASQPVPRLRGEIAFEGVDFTYRPDAESAAQAPGGEQVARREGERVTVSGFVPPDMGWVLRGFSLEVPAGQRLAVVGHTGAGKSSLARLIARFYEFQGGRILIDGRDIRDLDLGQYRRQIGMVPQVPFLFTGSVADNIRYGRPEAPDEAVAAAAARIGGGEWVADLPQGLQSEVGERGARLSLGQRQLVAMARVMLQDPRVFILDEATASVDPFTEEQIQTGLDAVMAGRTSIVIAHRLSTVRSADRIIVMRQGQIIEEGSHEALLGQGGHYAELYTTYFRHQSLEYIEAVGAFGE